MINLNDKIAFPDRMNGHLMSPWETIWDSDRDAEVGGRSRCCINCGYEQLYLPEDGVETDSALLKLCQPTVDGHHPGPENDTMQAIEMIGKTAPDVCTKERTTALLALSEYLIAIRKYNADKN